jgi:hypothetical protein
MERTEDLDFDGEDSVDYDIRILGERNWRNSALNREEWRKLLKKARASCSAVEPMMMMMVVVVVLYYIHTYKAQMEAAHYMLPMRVQFCEYQG